MRDPSIHVKLSDLEWAFDNVAVDGSESTYEYCAMIMRLIKHKSCSNRGIRVDNKKMEEKATKVASATISDTDLFANLLLNTRRQLKHRGIQQIKPSSKDWLILKEVVELANEFCNAFELEKREGYIKYITIGLGKMRNFNLSTLKSLAGYINSCFECTYELMKDEHRSETEEAYHVYNTKVLERTGISMGLENDPTKMIHFKRVAETCRKLRVSVKIYIRAQFAGLEYKEGLPEPGQLTNERAIQRLNKYLYEKNLKGCETKKVGLKNLKNL